MKRIIAIILAVIITGIPSFVLASDVTNAKYLGTVQVTENGTAAATNVSTVFTANLTGTLNAANSDAAMLYGSNDVAFMPAPPGSSTWATFVSSIGKALNIDYSLYVKDATDGKIRWFPGVTGMVTANNSVTLGPGANFTFETKGYFNTGAAAVGENITSKDNAFYTWVSGTENITSGISGVWTIPTSTNDPDSQWSNDANVYDGNTATYASDNVAGTSWSAYLDIIYSAPVWLDNVRTWTTNNCNQRSVDVWTGGAWVNVFEAANTDGSYQTTDLGGRYYTDRLRVKVYNSGALAELRINEVTFGKIETVTATGVASGEHTLETAMDSPFLSKGIDTASDPITPVTDNLTLNAPLWQVESNSAAFTTIDSNAFTATVTGAVWTNQGYDIGGGVNNISIPHDPLISATEFTLGVWAKRDDAVNSNYALIAKGDYNAAYSISYSYAASPILQAFVGTTAINSRIIDFTVWKYIVLTFDGTNARLYVDAVLEAGPTAATVLFNAYALLIGDERSSTFANLPGIVGEVRYYDKALTPTEISQNYNSTKSKYTTGNIYTYSTLSSVPDNGNDWYDCYAAAMPYVESVKRTINGVLRQSIAWEYATTFSDLSGNSNDATPTFRTTTSDANVTAVLTSMLPVTEAEVTSFSLGTAADILTTTPDAIPQMYSELNFTYIPAADSINAILDVSDVPRAFWWYPVLFLGMCIIGFMVYGATTRRVYQGRITDAGDQGSLLLMVLVLEGMLVLLGIMNPIPFWPAILALIPFMAIMLSTKHQSVG